MVDVISKENAYLYADALDDMHRMRYRVAVGEWGWRIPGVERGFDKDDFDTDETIYFVSLDPTGSKVLACSRLNPTTGATLLRDVFPHQCQFQDVPCDPAVFELSRYVVDAHAMSKETAIAVRARMSAAVNLFCLAAGIRSLAILTYMSSYARSLSVWPTRPLGLPTYYDDDEAPYIAALCDMVPQGLQKLRAGYGLRPEEPHLVTRLAPDHLPLTRRIQSEIRSHVLAA
ncbi:MAG: acyl-homoserine-lactone synthase [Pseudomonadota bacterium]|nr:acyl-homoserine-lactone synthase [Pseudomonadota bacterium]